MGFFKSPLGTNKKKAKVEVDESSYVSPKTVADTKQPSSASSPKKKQSTPKKQQQQLSLPPPLFYSVHETDRQLLKNLKGTGGGGTFRRLSLNSDRDAPVSVETAKKKLLLLKNNGRMVHKAASVAVRPTKDSNARFMASYGLSPFVGNNKPSLPKSLPKASSGDAPLPTALPLMDDDENDDKDKKTVVGIPPLPYSGSDSTGSLPPIATPNASYDERDTTETSKTPVSPTGSEGSHAKNHSLSSIRSATSPRQLQQPSSFRSATSPQQMQRPTSFRSVTSPNPLSKPSSFRSATSPNPLSKASSFRSAPSADDESYVEELVLEEGEYSYDEIEYYEEEIIEEEVEVDSAAFRDKPTTIKFDEYDEMQLTLNLNDYSDQELKKSWYKRKDYDEMIQEARQVALKEEERLNQLLSSMPAISETIPEQQQEQNPQLSSSAPPQHHPHKSELSARGLEAWTPSGAIQVRKIKEAAIEAVWDEQSRQWEAGIQDYEAMRQAYQKLSVESQEQAEERGYADQQVADKIRQLEELSTSDDVKKKRRRASNILLKSRSILGKSVKAAGKVARGTGKRSARAGVGAVTLDPRMLLEAIKIEKKKREEKKTEQAERCIFRQPSLSSRAMSLEASMMSSSSVTANGEGTNASGDQDVDASDAIHDKGAAISSTIKARADKLKLLGVVPIPGTKKMYDEDRRAKKLEKRSSERCGYATWEASLASEGKL